MFKNPNNPVTKVFATGIKIHLPNLYRIFRQLIYLLANFQNNQLLHNQRLVCLTAEILLALPFSWLFIQLKAGGISYIFAGIFAGMIILSTVRNWGLYLSPNRNARQVGLMLVGLTIGFSNANANLTQVMQGIPIFTLITLFLLLSGVFIGYIHARMTRTNLLTSMLATTPGGVGVMSAIAADYGRNVTLVALVQIIRVTSVILLIPLWVRANAASLINSPLPMTGSEKLTNGETNSIIGILIGGQPQDIFLTLVAIVTTIMVVNIAARLKIPAANFFGSLVVGILFNPTLQLILPTTAIAFTPPLVLTVIGQILLGITIGEYWGEKPPKGKRTIFYALVSTIMTLIAGAIAARIAMGLTNWDWLTCLLVTAPGGAAEMILVALTFNHNVEIVTAGHVVRLLAINFSLPIWVLLFRHLDRLADNPSA